MKDEFPRVSRLPDGRLLWRKGTDWRLIVDGKLVEPVGVKLGEVSDSKPLSKSEIEALMSSGTLPQ